MTQKIKGNLTLLENLLKPYNLKPSDLTELSEQKRELPGSLRPSPGRTFLLDQAICDFLETKKKMSHLTQKGYESDLKHFKSFMIKQWGEKKITEEVVSNITKGDVECFLSSIIPRRKAGNGKIKASAQNRKLAVVRGLFQYLVDEEILTKSPVNQIQWSKEGTLPIMFLTVKQQKDILWKALLNRENGLRNYTLIYLTLCTGLRLSEIVSLNTCDIDIDQYKFKVTGKGNKTRMGIIHKTVMPHLLRYLEYVKSNHTPIEGTDLIPLFINGKGKNRNERITHNAVEKMVAGVFRKCGILEGSIHRLRHTFAVQCLNQGVNVLSIMRLLGHSQITTTISYLRLSDDMVLNQVRENFPLAFVSIDNFSEFIKGQEGMKLKNALSLVKKEERKSILKDDSITMPGVED